MRRTEIKPLPFLHQAIPSGLSFQRLSIRHLPSSIRYQSFPLIVASLAPLVSPFGRLRQAPPRGLPRRWSAFQLSALSFCPRLRLSLSVFRSQPSACSFQPFSLLLPPSPRLIRFANPYGLPLAFYLPTVGCVALRAAFDRVDARLWSSTLRAPAGAVSISKRFALSGYPRGLPRRWSAFSFFPSAIFHPLSIILHHDAPRRNHLPSVILHLPSATSRLRHKYPLRPRLCSAQRSQPRLGLHLGGIARGEHEARADHDKSQRRGLRRRSGKNESQRTPPENERGRIAPHRLPPSQTQQPESHSHSQADVKQPESRAEFGDGDWPCTFTDGETSAASGPHGADIRADADTVSQHRRLKGSHHSP